MNEDDVKKLENIDGNTQADNRQLSHVVSDMLTRGVKQTRLEAEGAAVAMRREVPANVIADDLIDGDIKSPRNYNRKISDSEVENLNKMPGALFRGGTRDGSLTRWQNLNEKALKSGEKTFTDKEGYLYDTITPEEENAAYEEAEKVLEYYIENEKTRLPIELLRENDFVEFDIEVDSKGKLTSYYPTGLVTDLGVAIDLLELAEDYERKKGKNFAEQTRRNIRVGDRVPLDIQGNTGIVQSVQKDGRVDIRNSNGDMTFRYADAIKEQMAAMEGIRRVGKLTAMEEKAVQDLVDSMMFYSSPINPETRKGGGMSREDSIRMTFEESTLGSKIKDEALQRFNEMASNSWMGSVERKLIGTPAYEAARQAMIDGQDVFWDSGEVQNPESTIGLYSLWDYYDRETGLPLPGVEERGYMKFKPDDATYNSMKGYPDETQQMILDYVTKWVKDSVGSGPAIEEWYWDSDKGILRIYPEKMDPDCECTTTDMSGSCVSCGYPADKFEEYKWEDIFNIGSFPRPENYFQALAKFKYGTYYPVPARIESWNGKNYFLNNVEGGFPIDLASDDDGILFTYDIEMPEGSTFDDLRMEPDVSESFTSGQMKRIEELVENTYYRRSKKYNFALPPGTSNAIPMTNQRKIDGKRFTASLRGFPSKNQARIQASLLRDMSRLYGQPLQVRTIKLAGGWRNYIHTPNIGKSPFPIIPNYGKQSKFLMQNQRTEGQRIATSMIREKFPSINDNDTEAIMRMIQGRANRNRNRRGRMT